MLAGQITVSRWSNTDTDQH